jgi:phage baseplate assembly protein gpV
MYLGGLLNGIPSCFVQFVANGINIVSPTQVTIQSPTVTVDGNLVVTGTTSGTGNGTFNGKNVDTHVHSGVQSGSSNTGGPV